MAEAARVLLVREGRDMSTHDALNSSFIALALCALASAGCSGHQSEDAASHAAQALSNFPSSCLNRVCSASVNVPTGFGKNDFTLLAAQSLKLDPRAQVFAPDGSKGQAAALGSTGTDIGNSASMGQLLSVGSVLVEASASITGGITSAGTVSQQLGAVVSGAVLQHTPIPSTAVGLESLTLPVAFRATVNLEPGTSALLTPGAYDGLAIKSRSTATAQAGTLILGDFSLEPGATFSIQNQAGPVVIHVLNHFACKGTWSLGADTANVKLVYWGTDALSVECSLGATTFEAPFASVRVADRIKVGQVIAKDVELGADASAKTRLFHTLTTGAGSTVLTSLSKSDLQGACQQIQTFSGATSQELTCRFAGLSAARASKPASDADARATCQARYDACIQDPCSAPLPFPGPCTSTVDDWNACIEAWLPRLNAARANAPTCAQLTLHSAYSYTPAAALVFPQECLAINTCSGLSYH
jgi:hypothetical protein